MKLYLSSYRIPSLDELERLIGRPLADIQMAIIPNAKDYYSERARAVKIGDFSNYLNTLSIRHEVVDLRELNSAADVQAELAEFDVVWGIGGNTYCLRYEMKRSGFDDAIKELLDAGVVYGGDSAGAIVAGVSTKGVEDADEPAFAEEVVYHGLQLVPHVILPHTDNPDFHDTLTHAREVHKDSDVIELRDIEAVIYEGQDHRVIQGIAAVS